MKTLKGLPRINNAIMIPVKECNMPLQSIVFVRNKFPTNFFCTIITSLVYIVVFNKSKSKPKLE